MTTRKNRVTVARENNFALFSKLEKRIDRTFWLSKNRTISRASPASNRAATPVHQHEIDIVRACPLRYALLRFM